MNVYFQLDGCLWRFGDVTPDAVAAVGDVQRIEARVRASGAGRDVRLRFFLSHAEVANDADRIYARLAATLDSDWSAFTNIPLFESLSPQPFDVIITTSDSLYRESRAKGLWPIRVSDFSPNGEMRMPFAELGRGLEEHLRSPTARPMRSGVRQGGLLAINCESPNDAHELALQAIARDRNADWVIIDSMLLLYLEDADADDDIQATCDANRVSYSINKQELRLASGALPSDAQVLLSAGDYRLLDRAGSARIADVEFADWRTIRRRRLASGGRTAALEAVVTAPDIGIINDSAQVLGKDAEALISALRDKARHSADVIDGSDEPAGVTWTSEAAGGASAKISAWLYRAQDGFDEQAIASILRLTRWLRSFQERRHVMHCVLFEERNVDSILQQLLFDDERNRLGSIIEFGSDVAESVKPEIEAVAAPGFSPAKATVPAVTWRSVTLETRPAEEFRAFLLDALN